jgi:hypothetical protein
LKLQEENIGETLEDIGIGNTFLNRTAIAQEITARIGKWDCVKFKFLQRKRNNTRIKKQPIEWVKIFRNYSLVKELTPRIYKKP